MEQRRENDCCIHRPRRRLSEGSDGGSLLHMSVGLVWMTSQFSSEAQERSLKPAATGCRAATLGGGIGSGVHHIVLDGAAEVRPNKPLVPTRNAEAPLLTARRRR